MNITIAIVSILCFNGSIMQTNEENQGVLQEDRGNRRKSVKAQDHSGTTAEDAGWPWKIKITQGKEALVDEDVFHILSKTRWFVVNRYAARNFKRADGERRTQYMHVFIMSPVPVGMKVDHKNCNRLDNRRLNLRYATKQQDSFNRPVHRDSLTGVKGVTWHKQHQKWYAQIMVDGKNIFLGLFRQIEDAHKAYEKAAAKLHGRFARIK